MPNFDTGHYFLTVLAPIKKGMMVNNDGEKVSFVQNLHDILQTLPRSLQSPITQNNNINSPFVREKTTHFCRFTIIDDVVFNGRDKSNILIRSLEKINPITPQHVDGLKNQYVMFAVDFDAIMNIGDPLPKTLNTQEQNNVRDAYAKRLWQELETDIQNIYSNCVGFEKVKNADDFAQYIANCQIETTMSFNDYWISPPTLHKLPIVKLFILVGLPLITSIISFLFWIFGVTHLPFLHWSSGWSSILATMITVIVLYIIYRYIVWNGNRPMPPGKYADLRSVLKSLYIQQNFKQFAINAQSMNKDDLYHHFGKFLQQHQLYEKDSPTQHPGLIGIKNNIDDS